ncbi:unnamed protein product [Victoria cruziana]
MSSCCFSRLLGFLFCLAGLFVVPSESALKHYQFDIQVSNVSRLCHAKPIVTVNGRFPGPTIYAREGDRVIVNQFRNGWADGPAYVTQCPIQSGRSYTYDFNVTDQRGTLWWHAHILWLRATVHGAIVIMPKKSVPYPFPQPDNELNIVLGEWWHKDIEAMESQANSLGVPPSLFDAHTINGKPGPLFPCSEKHTYAVEVESNKTYMLRIVSAALNEQLFFNIAGHNMTVVEIDAVYCKPFTTNALLLAPGQTTNVLVQANQVPGRYFMAAKPFMDVPIPVDNKTATDILQYKGVPNTVTPNMPPLLSKNDIGFVKSFNDKLRSLKSPQFPTNIPLQIDQHLLFTIGLGRDPCPSCLNGSRFIGSINNITFTLPTVALLQAHYYKKSGEFTTDFSDRPPMVFNFTGAPLTANLGTKVGTRLSWIPFNSTVELVLQGTNLLGVESHPFHLHGYNFFVVGRGISNFDPTKDPANFNLIDPPERNTIAVPTGGWTAIRFRANNPGVWFMHCHLEVHTTWGLSTAFLVENGNRSEDSLLPPPTDLPPC